MPVVKIVGVNEESSLRFNLPVTINLRPRGVARERAFKHDAGPLTGKRHAIQSDLPWRSGHHDVALIDYLVSLLFRNSATDFKLCESRDCLDSVCVLKRTRKLNAAGRLPADARKLRSNQSQVGTDIRIGEFNRCVDRVVVAIAKIDRGFKRSVLV